MKIGIIDSGVNPEHPHVGSHRIAAGAAIGLYQNTPGAYLDFLGHGTAVAGAICDHCPQAQLYVAKVFDKTLRTRVEIILRAIEWCMDEQRVDLINLSLGTQNPAHREAFAACVARGAKLVAAAGSLPGGIEGVITVVEDPSLRREQWTLGDDGIYRASGRPRPIPGRTEEENLGGVSFAVANFTGLWAAAQSNR